MNTGDAGKSLIQSYEKCVLTAYPDPATGSDPWTCGWGSTGPDIVQGTVWTQDQADARFNQRIAENDNQLNSVITSNPNQNMWDACASLVYNIGIGNFKSSTLLKLLNAADYGGAADQFLVWNKAAGKVMNGLVARRQAERNLFLTPWG